LGNNLEVDESFHSISYYIIFHILVEIDLNDYTVESTKLLLGIKPIFKFWIIVRFHFIVHNAIYMVMWSRSTLNPL